MIEINGVQFVPRPDCKYLHDYVREFEKVKAGEYVVAGKTAREVDLIRALIREDLWFVFAFVLKNPLANHPFLVDACREVQFGPDNFTLDLWGREHCKSSIITHAETIQKMVTDPESRNCIISFSQRAALKHFHVVKQVLETSHFLYSAYSDVLYRDPNLEAYKWSDQNGLYLRRKSNAREATLEAWSLLDAMPVGSHFTRIVYDDVETDQTVNSPEMMEKLEQQFDNSMNLGSADGTHRVVGTTWHYEGLLERLRNRKNSDNKLLYKTRIKASTIDGTFNGAPSLHSQEWLDARRANPKIFAAQHLLNPSLTGVLKLDPTRLIEVEPEHLPNNLYKFLLIDPAGMKPAKRRDRQDSWAMLVIGVYPYRDDLGASDVYILDMIVDLMNEAEAMDNIVKLYSRNGMILKVGVEKVGMTTTEIHVANALRAKGIHLSIDNESLVVLRPAGRSKEVRVEAALQWPLLNGKIKVSKGIPSAYRERLKLEMEKFPYWHDDALDALSYGYDIIKGYKFPSFFSERSKGTEYQRWERHRRELDHKWMVV